MYPTKSTFEINVSIGTVVPRRHWGRKTRERKEGRDRFRREGENRRRGDGREGWEEERGRGGLKGPEEEEAWGRWKCE